MRSTNTLVFTVGHLNNPPIRSSRLRLMQRNAYTHNTTQGHTAICTRDPQALERVQCVTSIISQFDPFGYDYRNEKFNVKRLCLPIRQSHPFNPRNNQPRWIQNKRHYIANFQLRFPLFLRITLT